MKDYLLLVLYKYRFRVKDGKGCFFAVLLTKDQRPSFIVKDRAGVFFGHQEKNLGKASF